MKIATWNVNSVKARLTHLLAWREEAKPDGTAPAREKRLDADFPALKIKGLGYHIETLGQRSYNGVAILSKEPARDIVRGLPGDDSDPQGALYRGDHRRFAAVRLDLSAERQLPSASEKYSL